MRGTTQVGQYTSMVVDMCERYDKGRSVYKHGSRHVCVERYETGRSVYKHGSRHVCVCVCVCMCVGDKKRHKCLDEKSKHISKQKGAVQCSSCLRWFASKGGFSVHRCPGQ